MSERAEQLLKSIGVRLLPALIERTEVALLAAEKQGSDLMYASLMGGSIDSNEETPTDTKDE